jgi:hypothetical protein
VLEDVVGIGEVKLLRPEGQRSQIRLDESNTAIAKQAGREMLSRAKQPVIGCDEGIYAYCRAWMGM